MAIYLEAIVSFWRQKKCRSNSAVLVMMVGCVLLCLFAFTARAQNGNVQYERAKLWEKEIAAFAEADKKEFPKTVEVLFVGSSSIRGWRTLAEDFPDFRTLNRGFGGSRLEDVNFYVPQIVLPYKPELIVLYAGENDLVAGKAPQKVFDDYRQFVSLVHEKLPKTRIIFVSIKPGPARWKFRDKFAEANELIRIESQKDKRLAFVDVFKSMLEETGEPKKEIFLGDGIHLNREGYKIWREALAPHIRRGIKKNF